MEKVRMEPLINLAAGRALVASAFRPGPVAIQGLGQFEGGHLFTHSLGSAKEIGLMDLVPQERLLQIFYGSILALNCGEGHEYGSFNKRPRPLISSPANI
jgi:hypothetical protein